MARLTNIISRINESSTDVYKRITKGIYTVPVSSGRVQSTISASSAMTLKVLSEFNLKINIQSCGDYNPSDVILSQVKQKLKSVGKVYSDDLMYHFLVAGLDNCIKSDALLVFMPVSSESFLVRTYDKRIIGLIEKGIQKDFNKAGINGSSLVESRVLTDDFNSFVGGDERVRRDRDSHFGDDDDNDDDDDDYGDNRRDHRRYYDRSSRSWDELNAKEKIGRLAPAYNLITGLLL